jgi:DNA-binding MarR family transcriptional regulator
MRNISKPGPTLEEDAQQLEELILALGRATHGLRDPIAANVHLHSLTPPQKHTLMWLGWDGRLTMGEIAQRGNVTEKTITGVVDRLEAAGLVQRVRDEKDRRVVHVELTAQGRKAFEEIRAFMRAKFRGFLGLLDDEDRQALVRILEKLHRRMISSSRPATAGDKESA